MLETLIKLIEGTLKLRVNRDKSGVFRPNCIFYVRKHENLFQSNGLERAQVA